MKSILIAFLCLCGVLAAADLRLSNGERFRDYTVTKVEPNGLRITHTDGTAFVDFDSLPREMWAQYGWSSEKSAARKAALAKAAEEQRAQQAVAAKAAADVERTRQASLAAADRDARMAESRRAETVMKKQEAELTEQKRIVDAAKAEDDRKETSSKIYAWSLVAGALLLGLLPMRMAAGKRAFGAVLMIDIAAIGVSIGSLFMPPALVGLGIILGAVLWVMALSFAIRLHLIPEQNVNVTTTVLQANQPQPRPMPKVIAVRPVHKNLPPTA